MTKDFTCGVCWCTVPNQYLDDHRKVCNSGIEERIIARVVEALREGGQEWYGKLNSPTALTSLIADRLAKKQEPKVTLPEVDWRFAARHFEQVIDGRSWPNMAALARLIVEGKAEIRLKEVGDG